jgi:hypothetical protein
MECRSILDICFRTYQLILGVPATRAPYRKANYQECHEKLNPDITIASHNRRAILRRAGLSSVINTRRDLIISVPRHLIPLEIFVFKIF